MSGYRHHRKTTDGVWIPRDGAGAPVLIENPDGPALLAYTRRVLVDRRWTDEIGPVTIEFLTTGQIRRLVERLDPRPVAYWLDPDMPGQKVVVIDPVLAAKMQKDWDETAIAQSISAGHRAKLPVRPGSQLSRLAHLLPGDG